MDDKSPESDEARALQEANALLRRIGFGARQFARFEDLVASASSMSVALYEKLFQLRLERVERAPRSLAHYEANAQRVLDALSAALLEAPPPREEDGGDGSDAGVTGAALCAGDVRAIRHVVRMFEHVLSLLAAASITPLPARARKKGAVRKTRKIRTSRSQQQQQRQSRSFGSGSESDNAREARSTRRVMMQSGGAATRRQGRSQQQQQRDDANLYETSDASITRSRVGELPSRRRTLDGTDRQRSDYDARNLMHDDEDDDAGSPELTDPLAATVRRRRGPEEKKARAKTLSGKARQDQVVLRDIGVTDPSLLLETQKYGRFVPVAASRSRHANSRRGSDGASGNEADDGAQGPTNDEDAQEEELMYFGGVSSVSSGSRSDESVHFIEEDDDDASRDFSSSNVVDLQNIPPRNSLSPSNAYDEPRHFDHSNGAPADSKSALQQPQETRKPNQEAEEMAAEVASGADKKLPSRKPPPKSVPDRQLTGTRTRVRDPASSLYPLLPKKSAATSKSQAEYTRYKLFLKDHLQDLRQVRQSVGLLFAVLALTMRRHDGTSDEPERVLPATALGARVQSRRAHCECREGTEYLWFARGLLMVGVGELTGVCWWDLYVAVRVQIRARRFQQDIRLQRIAIGLEAKNEEEKHLRHTLTHILELEKAKLRDEHRTTASILKQIQKDHLDREVAMETLYVLAVDSSYRCWFSVTLTTRLLALFFLARYPLCLAMRTRLSSSRNGRTAKCTSASSSRRRIASRPSKWSARCAESASARYRRFCRRSSTWRKPDGSVLRPRSQARSREETMRERGLRKPESTHSTPPL